MRIEYPCLLAPNGDHVPAPMLRPAEAAEMWRRGTLRPKDCGTLTRAALRAVSLAFVGLHVHPSGIVGRSPREG